MASSHAEIFGSLRTRVLDTLVDSRQSIDDSFGALSEEEIRRNFLSVLEQMQKYLISPSPAQLHQSVSKWTAMFLGFGLSTPSILRTVVTLGDLIVQVAKNELPAGPATNLFVRDVVRLNFNTAREVVAIFNDELESQRRQNARGLRGS